MTDTKKALGAPVDLVLGSAGDEQRKEMKMKISPIPWKRDQYGNVLDARGERVTLTGCALATGRVRGDDECHGNTALLFAAPHMRAALVEVLEYFDVPEDGCFSDDALVRLREALALAPR